MNQPLGENKMTEQMKHYFELGAGKENFEWA